MLPETAYRPPPKLFLRSFELELARVWLPMKPKLRAIILCILAAAVAVPALSKKKPEPLATLTFLVVRDENDRPIRNAAVVMHPVDESGKQERGGLELKTDPEGKATYDGVPYGKLRVQVLAPGFQTYGEDYQVTQPSMDITIKLKRPAKQYSIYDGHPADNKDQKPAPPDKPQN